MHMEDAKKYEKEKLIYMMKKICLNLTSQMEVNLGNQNLNGIQVYQMWEDSRLYSGEYNKLVSVAGVNPPSDKRSAGMRRDSVRKMSAKADPNPAPRPVSGS